MKDLLRMLGYSVGAIAVITLLIQASSTELSAGMGVVLALVLVIVVPVALAIILSSRKKSST